jgi:hypothetical protein
MKFIVNNQEDFDANSALHSTNTRNMRHIRISTATPFVFTEECIQCCHLIFSSVLCRPTRLVNGKARFEAVYSYRIQTSFRSVSSIDEFLMLKNDLLSRPQRCTADVD